MHSQGGTQRGWIVNPAVQHAVASLVAAQNSRPRPDHEEEFRGGLPAYIL